METVLARLHAVAQTHRRLTREAAEQYEPLVAGILRERTRDTARIERTLDGLLDFAFDPTLLTMFKRLCRYYWDIDPVVTASYVNYYREMWDSETEEASDSPV